MHLYKPSISPTFLRKFRYLCDLNCPIRLTPCNKSSRASPCSTSLRNSVGVRGRRTAQGPIGIARIVGVPPCHYLLYMASGAIPRNPITPAESRRLLPARFLATGSHTSTHDSTPKHLLGTLRTAAALLDETSHLSDRGHSIAC
jgi:hypothetical protein